MTPDRTLVEAVARDGDEVAFRELYRRHTPRLYPLVLRMVGGAEMDAEAPHGQRLDLERAIALLPPGCRTVLVLHDIEGFTHEEIATQLGIAVGTSKSQLFAARRAARTLLTGTKEMTHARPVG
jgi:DNA-directed RNA polymerase specialized sigma24 family protein